MSPLALMCAGKTNPLSSVTAWEPPEIHFCTESTGQKHFHWCSKGTYLKPRETGLLQRYIKRSKVGVQRTSALVFRKASLNLLNRQEPMWHCTFRGSWWDSQPHGDGQSLEYQAFIQQNTLPLGIHCSFTYEFYWWRELISTLSRKINRRLALLLIPE